MKIYDIDMASETKIFWEELYPADSLTYLGEALFPAEKTNKTSINFFKGYKKMDVVLQLSAYDVKAPIRDRIGVAELTEKMPFFKESMRLDETQRRELQDAIALNESRPGYVNTVLKPIFDDVANLVSGAFSQMERMRMDLVFFAKIEFKVAADTGRNAHKVIDYDPNGGWATNNTSALTGTAKWTVENKATSTPIQDIKDIVKMARRSGSDIKNMLLNSTTYDGMIASDSIIKAINPNGATSAIYSEEQLVNYVESMTGIKIVIYDKHFGDETGATKTYCPDGYAAFLPNGPLGKTMIGYTPHEYDLLSMKTEVSTGKDTPNGASTCEVIRGGLGPTIMAYKELDPVNLLTVVSLTALPSFEMLDHIYVLNAQGV